MTPSSIHALELSVLIGHESALFHVSPCCLTIYACSLISPHVYHAPYCSLYYGVSPLFSLGTLRYSYTASLVLFKS
jgi:hypothetical protein